MILFPYMTILVQNSLEVEVNLTGRKLTSEEIFRLSSALDAYEIRHHTEKEVVVDVKEIRADGSLTVFIDPKKQLSYSQIHDHVMKMCHDAMKSADLEDLDAEMSRVTYITENPGEPSVAGIPESMTVDGVKQRVLTMWGDVVERSIDDARRELGLIEDSLSPEQYEKLLETLTRSTMGEMKDDIWGRVCTEIENMVPEAENTLETQKEFDLDQGKSYLVLEDKPDKSFRIFVDQITHGVPGFIVTRQFPQDVRDKYGLERTDILWLSTRHDVPGTLDPANIGLLDHAIREYMDKTEHCVVLLDGLEYVVTTNTFNRVIRVLNTINETVMVNRDMLIVPLDPKAFEEKDLAQLVRYMETI